MGENSSVAAAVTAATVPKIIPNFSAVDGCVLKNGLESDLDGGSSLVEKRI